MRSVRVAAEPKQRARLFSPAKRIVGGHPSRPALPPTSARASVLLPTVPTPQARSKDKIITKNETNGNRKRKNTKRKNSASAVIAKFEDFHKNNFLFYIKRILSIVEGYSLQRRLLRSRMSSNDDYNLHSRLISQSLIKIQMQKTRVDKEVPTDKPIMSTHGVTRCKGKEFTYTWYIHNFKAALIVNNEPWNSPTFSTDVDQDLTWFLKMSAPQSSSEYLSLKLFIAPKNDVIQCKNKVCLDLAIVNRKGREKVSLQTSFVPVNVNSNGIGFDAFVQKAYVNDKNNELLHNGTLTIRCKLFFFDKIVDETKSTPLQQRKSCNCNLEELFETKKLSDTILITSDQKFEAHKCILAARSSVFSAMFEHNMKEKNKNEVEIDDIEPQVIEEMLQYIYCGKTQGFEDISSLLIAADKYQIDDLKSICEYQLIEGMDAENVGKTLIFADRYKAEVLKKSVIKFIVTHSSEIKFDKFKEDVQSYSPLLVDMVQGLM